MSVRAEAGATRSAVVTGAAEGIGRAIVEDLLEHSSYQIVGVDLQSGPLGELVDAANGRVRPVLGDAAEWETHLLAAQAAEEEGALECWVNNAGNDVFGGAHEVTKTDIEAGLRTNQFAPMYGTSVAIRTMLPRQRGSIVNISSIQGVFAFPRYFAYQAAKAAVIMFSKGVAMDYGPSGIRCNVVCPGTIATPMLYKGLSSDPERARRELEQEARLAPLGRVGEPREVAKAVTFLLSDASSFITGAVLTVDGGASTRCFAYPTQDDRNAQP